MPAKPYLCANSSKRWAIFNPRLPSRLTTAPHLGSSPTTSNCKVQRPWTCVSTGYAVANNKTNSGTIGNLEPTTDPTTRPSIIAQLTTLKSARKLSPQNSYSMPYEHQLTEHQQLWAKVLSKQQTLPPLHDPTQLQTRGTERVC